MIQTGDPSGTGKGGSSIYGYMLFIYKINSKNIVFSFFEGAF